ncbi:RNA polymerase sigma factor [Chitinophaga sancti]|uniref:RNA polymerase sigma-70 factor n=1 Tax=Chitinophaga sancti TaxID=1004 RepID=A0A1K1SKG8_9BACT|nr:RNA polymerase sigma-70 factor [Chitinophaga sancti]WQD65489.1 RNA polymerase sigma-70 factor [Chitinophaga sancti]WQG88888.1 RNA polymerase sigma-70 factor [Chitinophaga sancti]SFW84798.1 RNA polymerase sigma-70 factor, ECF subfamily [Chitinophaga sancti]
MEPSEDKALFHLIKSGDEVAFTTMFDKYKTLLFIIAFRCLDNEFEAHEAVQETFVYVWEKRKTIEIQSSPKNYLVGAVRNYCFNCIRKRNATQRRDEQYAYRKDPFVVSNRIEHKELAKTLQNAINTIKPSTRTSFEMHYIEGISQKEIAKKRGISLQTVKNQVFSALKQLRSNLSK